jgi:hypothetical protein
MFHITGVFLLDKLWRSKPTEGSDIFSPQDSSVRIRGANLYREQLALLAQTIMPNCSLSDLNDVIVDSSAVYDY